MAFNNVEIKARSTNHARLRKYLKEHGADYKGVDHQIDTYFIVPTGRLKLRQGTIENNLIFYKRTDQSGPKQSEIIFTKVVDGTGMNGVLTDALGQLVKVDKSREIYFIDNVKFHIDTVEGLGDFMEIEAIDYDGDIGVEKLREQCNYYMQELAIKERDLLTSSYSDMLLEAV